MIDWFRVDIFLYVNIYFYVLRRTNLFKYHRLDVLDGITVLKHLEIYTDLVQTVQYTETTIEQI